MCHHRASTRSGGLDCYPAELMGVAPVFASGLDLQGSEIVARGIPLRVAERGSRSVGGEDSLGLNWICRLKVTGKNPRWLAVTGGKEKFLRANEAADAVVPHWKSKMTIRGRGKKRRVVLKYGSRGVRLVRKSERGDSRVAYGPTRTLVVVHGPWPQPIVLLVSSFHQGRAADLDTYRRYLRRWRVEESIRSLKDSRGWGVRLEDVRALTLRGVRRMAMLAAMIYLFIAEVMAGCRKKVERLIASAKTFGDVLRDKRYRMFRAVSGRLCRTGLLRLQAWRGPDSPE